MIIIIQAKSLKYKKQNEVYSDCIKNEEESIFEWILKK